MNLFGEIPKHTPTRVLRDAQLSYLFFSSQVEGAERVGWADRGLVWSGGRRVPQEIKIGIKGHEISLEMPPMGIALQEA